MLNKKLIARTAKGLLHPDDNATRDGLKAIARDVVNELMSAQDKAKYKNDTGLSINRTIDMVSREVLIACIGTALDDLFHEFIRDLTEAMQDDTVCMPKQRGSGVSRGYHKDFNQRHTFETMIHKHAGAVQNMTTLEIITVAREAIAIYQAANENASVELAVVGAGLTQLGLIPADNEKAVTKELSNSVANNPTYESVFDDLIPVMQQDISNLVQYIVKASGASQTQAAAKPAATEPTTIDPNLAPAVDALLKQATNGSLVSITKLIQDNHDSWAQKAALEEELERLRNASVVASKPSQTVGEVGDLKYEVVMQKASDLFTDKHGRKSKKLDFEVVTLRWTNSNGDVVRHPMCPEVDETYQFRMWHLIRFLSGMKFGQNIWLHGHTGTGKTTLAMQIAARLGIPVERLNLDSNIERSDMVGATNIIVKDGAPATEFQEGILPRAMRQPCWMILDELDAGRADALFAIQRVLEGNGLTLTEQGGDVVEQHELFRIVATANSRGQGDEHGWYAGVRPMNLAMLNRFGAFIEVPYLDKDDEVELLKRAYPSLAPKYREEMAGYAELVREAFKSGEISQTISPRNLHSMAMYFLHYNSIMPEKEAIHEAVRTTVIDSAPADNAQRLEELYQRVFGVV